MLEPIKTQFINIIPVLPTANLERDLVWYREKMGLEVYFADAMYAVLYRENLCIHLQWHADTEDDPILGGSVIRIYVNNLEPLFEGFCQRGTITVDKLQRNTS